MSIMPAVAGVSVPVRLAIPDAEHKKMKMKYFYTWPQKTLNSTKDGKVKSTCISTKSAPTWPELILRFWGIKRQRMFLLPLDGTWANCRLTPHPYTMQWLQLEFKPRNSWLTVNHWLTITPLHVPLQIMAVSAIGGMFIMLLVNFVELEQTRSTMKQVFSADALWKQIIAALLA